jgi:hypothetical protein
MINYLKNSIVKKTLLDVSRFSKEHCMYLNVFNILSLIVIKRKFGKNKQYKFLIVYYGYLTGVLYM